MGVKLARAVSAVWGFAESTLFFLVPDVWLTWLAAERGWRPAAVGSLFALLGALAGGSLLYAWGAANLAGARAVLDWVPSISTGMLDQVARDLESDGAMAIVVGSFSGVPFKTFAAQSAMAGIGFGSFLAHTVLGRLSRFFLVSLLAFWIAQRLPERTRTRVHLGFWVLFYIGYLGWVPN